jgi:hypothetical protein
MRTSCLQGICRLLRHGSCVRSLTPRQREILQCYADDVEGRPYYFTTTPPSTQTSQFTSNGTADFHENSSSSFERPSSKSHTSPSEQHQTSQSPPGSHAERSSERSAGDDGGDGGFLGGLLKGVKSAFGRGDKR